MRALRIVMTNPDVGDVIELVSTEAHEVVEAFPFYCPDERFREGIRLGCLDRTANSFGTVRALLATPPLHKTGFK